MEHQEDYSQKPISQTNPNCIRKKIGCEAKTHNPTCPCLNCPTPQADFNKCPLMTRQHIIPKELAKKMGWKTDRINDPSNKQRLSKPCHDDADKDLPKLYNRLQKEEANGRKITPEYILLFREMSS